MLLYNNLAVQFLITHCHYCFQHWPIVKQMYIIAMKEIHCTYSVEYSIFFMECHIVREMYAVYAFSYICCPIYLYKLSHGFLANCNAISSTVFSVIIILYWFISSSIITCILIWYSLFPLLQHYDEKINLSIVGYFGVVKAISSHQKELSSSPPDLVSATFPNTQVYLCVCVCLHMHVYVCVCVCL